METINEDINSDDNVLISTLEKIRDIHIEAQLNLSNLSRQYKYDNFAVTIKKKIRDEIEGVNFDSTKKKLQYEMDDEINIDNRKEIYEFNESDGDESHFLKRTFQQLQQSNQINQQFIATKKGNQSFEDSEYDEKSENYTISDEQEDYGNIISLINDNTPSPKVVELIETTKEGKAISPINFF